MTFETRDIQRGDIAVCVEIIHHINSLGSRTGHGSGAAMFAKFQNDCR